MTRRAVFAILLSACALLSAQEGVKVSSFGFNAEDSTEIIQRALDSGTPKLIFDKQAGPWITRPLVARSNQELVFEDGVELLAKKGEFHGIRDYLFRCEGTSNLVIRGLGPSGGTFRMHKRDYQKPPYARSEWRYTLRLCGVENVHVENMHFVSSGGDGIVIGAFQGKSSKNVVIRNCVCDDNHRQGISLCGGEDILIENTVLSNTSGTPPQAGIDFEPDRPNEKLARVTLRNVLSKNNGGCGFDFYLTNMRDWSEPVSITLENCRAEGNRTSVSVTADNKHDTGVVKGRVSFVNTVFADGRSRGVNVCGIPSGALDVSFTDCVISNAAAGAKTSDFILSAGSSRQGIPDGLTLKNLTVYQPESRPWFSFGQSSYGPAPSNIAGNVTVVSPDGARKDVKVDADWIAENIPVVNGGRMPAPRVGLPSVKDVVVHDEKPGELVDLPLVSLISGGHYLLFVPKPGPVRLVSRQVDIVGNRPATVKPAVIRYLPEKGGKPRSWKRDLPGFTPGEIEFNAPAAGFYTLQLPRGGTRQQLLKSSVPVGIDVTTSERIIAGVKGNPVSLWFDVNGGTPFTFSAFGSDYYRFKAAVVNPLGEKVASKDVVSSEFSVDVSSENAAPGLWRVDFSKARKPCYDWIRIDLSGVPGCLFLTCEKRWTTRKEPEAARLVLAERGRKAARAIVIAEKATPSQRYAAEELRAYTAKMTGVEMPIVTDAAPLPAAAILVGPTRHTDAVMGGADPGAAARGTDGFRLKACPPHLVVHASGSRGCLYGVYELLETYGGVGWFASWRTVVPSRDEFAVPVDLDVSQTPAFHMRLTSWRDATDGDFACHMRLNGSRARLEDRHGGAVCRFGRHLGNCHTYGYLLPVKKYFKDHPEYFAMRDGKREINEAGARWGYTQPCLTNPDVLRIVTSNVLAAIAADPEAGLYGVSQNDNQRYCQCPACAAVDAEEGSHAGTTVRFVNAVAAEVEKHYPNAVIETLAYQYTRKPPKKTRLRHNVMPCLCSIECDFHKPMDKSGYAQNVAFVEDIRGWKAQTDMLYLWDYTTNFRHYMHAFPNIMALQGNLRFYRDNGVKYMLEQGDSMGNHADFAELRAWLIAKWMWNPDAPVEPLLDRFFKGYYGAAAPFVRKYFDELYALPRDSAKQPLRIYEPVQNKTMPTEFFERAEGLWKEAEAAVADDPPCRSNVVAGALSTAYTLAWRLPRPRRIWVTRHPEAFAADSRVQGYARRLLDAYKPLHLRFAESPDRNKTDIETLKGFLDMKPGKPCDSVEVPAGQLTFRLPGVRGEYVKDADALDGTAIKLYNTHYEWSASLHMRDVAYDADADYRIRVRVKVEKEPGATGEAFWAGVYDTEAKRGYGQVAPKVTKCGDGYVWYTVGKWRPKDSQYFWIGPGRFKKNGGKSSVKGVWVDRVEMSVATN